MNLTLAVFRDGEAVEIGRHKVIHHKVLDGADQFTNIVRQFTEHGCVATSRRHH